MKLIVKPLGEVASAQDVKELQQKTHLTPEEIDLLTTDLEMQAAMKAHEDNVKHLTDDEKAALPEGISATAKLAKLSDVSEAVSSLVKITDEATETKAGVVVLASDSDVMNRNVEDEKENVNYNAVLTVGNIDNAFADHETNSGHLTEDQKAALPEGIGADNKLVKADDMATTERAGLVQLATLDDIADGGEGNNITSELVPITHDREGVDITLTRFTKTGNRLIAFAGSYVLISDNDGDSWRVVDVIKGASSGIVACGDNVITAGYQVGSNIGYILTSHDKGETWEQKSAMGVQFLNSVAFQDANTAWAVGNKGCILKSIDGGDTWDFVNTGLGLTEYFYTIAIDGNNIIIAGSNGVIISSTDGGQTFEQRTTGTTNTFKTLAIYKNYAIAVGSNVTFRSIDSGVTWTEQTPVHESTVYAVAMNEYATYLTVSTVGIVKYSPDHGATWEDAPFNTESTTNWRYMVQDGKKAYFLSNQNELLKVKEGNSSSDNALTAATGYALVQEQLNNHLEQHSHLTEEDIIDMLGEGAGGSGSGESNILNSELLPIVPEGGAVVSYKIAKAGDRLIAPAQYGSSAALSDDEGETWRRVTCPYGYIYCFAARGDNAVYAGSSGFLVTSHDKGETWAQKETGVAGTINRIAFQDDNTVWAVGASFTIIKSTDGGETWNPVDTGLGLNLQLNAIAIHENNIIITGNSGLIISSTDGGQTFEQRTTGVTYAISYAAVYKNHAYVTGGATLISDDNGVTWTQKTSPSVGSVNFLVMNEYATYLGGTGIGAVRVSFDYGHTWNQAGYNLKGADYWRYIALDGKKAYFISPAKELLRVSPIPPQNATTTVPGALRLAEVPLA